MPRSASRRLFLSLVIVAFAGLGVGSAVAPALAAPNPPSATVAAARAPAKPSSQPRRGHVRPAWPATSAHRPKSALARWLARQVGPRKPVVCAKRPTRARARCAAGKAKTSAGVATAITMRASIARAGTGALQTEPIALRPTKRVGALELIRSFDIPADDPSYDRLLNWSWTYDSAVAATAFTTVGLQDQAGRLLDQLAALQAKDGSIDFAFNVASGESSGEIRAGTVAFASIAFTDYDTTFDTNRYLDNASRAADYLLSLQNDDGLVRGGPDVKWVSTQHNILSVIALSILAGQFQKNGDDADAATYSDAADGISKGIDSQLLVSGDQLAHFREGVGDNIVPLDTQALGVIYETFRKNPDLAKQVFVYAQKNFAIDGRSIQLSKKPSTYNMTYQAAGPFSGYRPYLGKNAPDVLWFEGTAEMRFISSAVGQPTDTLDASMNAWWDVTRPQGLAPLGADRTVTNNPDNEYHVWPTAAAGAWTVLSGAAKDTDWATPPQLLSLLR
jgi:hypothetical protein